MKKKMTTKKKYVAFLLNKDEEFNYSMKKIGDFLGVSQSTVSTAIKDVEYERRIKNLENELNEARTLIPANLKNNDKIIEVSEYEIEE